MMDDVARSALKEAARLAPVAPPRPSMSTHPYAPPSPKNEIGTRDKTPSENSRGLNSQRSPAPWGCLDTMHFYEDLKGQWEVGSPVELVLTAAAELRKEKKKKDKNEDKHEI